MTLDQRVQSLEEFVYKGELPGKTVFDTVALFQKGVSLKNGSFLYGGSATTNAGIKLDVGTPPKGSIYISSNGVGEIWIMQTTTWTQLTIN